MNLDLLYIISFVLQKGNTLSNTDILKLNLKSSRHREITLAFHKPELHLYVTDRAGRPEKHAQNPRLTSQGLHTKTGWELERILKDRKLKNSMIFNCQG